MQRVSGRIAGHHFMLDIYLNDVNDFRFDRYEG